MVVFMEKISHTFIPTYIPAYVSACQLLCVCVCVCAYMCVKWKIITMNSSQRHYKKCACYYLCSKIYFKSKNAQLQHLKPKYAYVLDSINMTIFHQRAFDTIQSIILCKQNFMHLFTHFYMRNLTTLL